VKKIGPKHGKLDTCGLAKVKSATLEPVAVQVYPESESSCFLLEEPVMKNLFLACLVVVVVNTGIQSASAQIVPYKSVGSANT